MNRSPRRLSVTPSLYRQRFHASFCYHSWLSRSNKNSAALGSVLTTDATYRHTSTLTCSRRLVRVLSQKHEPLAHSRYFSPMEIDPQTLQKATVPSNTKHNKNNNSNTRYNDSNRGATSEANVVRLFETSRKLAYIVRHIIVRIIFLHTY